MPVYTLNSIRWPACSHFCVADDEHAAGSMGGTHAWTPGTASAGRSGGNDGDTPADPEPRSGDGRHPAGDTSDHGTDADMAGVRTPGSWGKARSGGAAVWAADAERLLEADADTRGEGEEGGSVPSAAGEPHLDVCFVQCEGASLVYAGCLSEHEMDQGTPVVVQPCGRRMLSGCWRRMLT